MKVESVLVEIIIVKKKKPQLLLFLV